MISGEKQIVNNGADEL